MDTGCSVTLGSFSGSTEHYKYLQYTIWVRGWRLWGLSACPRNVRCPQLPCPAKLPQAVVRRSVIRRSSGLSRALRDAFVMSKPASHKVRADLLPNW